jgi:hypothetical protein
MDALKNYLFKNNIFSKKELDTLVESNINYCNYCNNNCGQLVELVECNNNLVMCFNCLEKLHDNYDTKSNELFKCKCCNNLIYDFNFI